MIALKKTKQNKAKTKLITRTTAKKTVAPKLPAKQVLAWLQAHPAFFETHKEALGTLAVPKKGGNILSLHAAKADKVSLENQKLKARQKQLVALAAHNVATADSLFEAMVGLMAVKTLAELGKFVQGDLRKILDVPVARLYKVGKADSETSLTAETIEDWCPKAVVLKPLETVETRAVYGAKGKMMKSDCRIKLYDNNKLVGLMMLASEDAARFHAGQGTELAARFGQAVGVALSRVTNGK